MNFRSLVCQGTPETSARKIVIERQNGFLIPGDNLNFDRLGLADVCDVIENPKKYDEATLADPIEPEYGGGVNKAKLYINDEDITIVHSFAHGGRNFYIKDQWTAETVMARIKKKRLDANSDPDYWKSLMFRAQLGPSGDEKVLGFLVSIGVDKKRSLSSEWKQYKQNQRQEERRKEAARNNKAIIVHSNLDNNKSLLETDNALLLRNLGWGYYSYGGRLSLIVKERPYRMQAISGKEIDIPDILKIKQYDKDTLAMVIKDAVSYFQKKNDGSEIQIEAPRKVITGLLSHPTPLAPKINGLASHPVINLSGELVSKNGLDKKTGLYLDFNQSKFVLPQSFYSLLDAKQAVERIKNTLFREFEWKDDKLDLASALTLLLTSIERKLLETAPGFLVIANGPAAGKTTLCRMIYITVTGCNMPVGSLSENNNNESKKEMLSILLESPEIICFDNVPDGSEVDDPVLARIITSPYLKDRLLNFNTTASVPTNSAIMVTGNNVTLSSDLIRRFVTITLQPKSETPETRRFEKSDVVKNCIDNREQIILDALTIIKGYFDDSNNNQDPPPSGFPAWDKMVRFPIFWAMGVDPWEAIKNNKKTSREYVAIRSTLSGLNYVFKNGNFRAVDVENCLKDKNFWAANVENCVEDENFLAADVENCVEENEKRGLPNEVAGLFEGLDALVKGKELKPKNIGRALQKIKGREMDGKILEITPTKNGNLYKIHQTPPSERIPQRAA